ncbi:E3 ubiquitin-protein ligase mind-bomb [Fasciola gigantica]|uniref:E3 ubiquitin-protein ligase mind-bomb n=1 Tax=Fasciola gigantica TaxID=46835 RepID=A0A504YEU8_FASGI|nr:E3 ubiquitin-protein ligase mind-bomb [Fasciola gigantica]
MLLFSRIRCLGLRSSGTMQQHEGVCVGGGCDNLINRSCVTNSSAKPWAAVGLCEDCDGDSPLHDAIAGLNLRIVELLLQHNADLTITNNSGQNPLHFATVLGEVNSKIHKPSITWGHQKVTSNSFNNERSLENNEPSSKSLSRLQANYFFDVSRPERVKIISKPMQVGSLFVFVTSFFKLISVADQDF